MRIHLRAFCTAVLLCFAAAAQAQTFTFTGHGSLPDYVDSTRQGTEVSFPVTVSGLPTRIDTNFGLSAACIAITHTFDGDLTASLLAPSGLRIPLLNRDGGGGQDFVGTCFSMGSRLRIINASAPFTNVFQPDGGDLNDANQGLNPNGVWQLLVMDNAGRDTGWVNSFSITFGANPPRTYVPPPPPPPAPVCSFTNMLACDCPDGSDTCDLLPDMRASAAVMGSGRRTEHTGYLTVSNGTPNTGYGPLEIHGTRECFCNGQPISCDSVCPGGVKEKVVQTIYRKTGATYSSYTRPAGYMVYHPEHGHVHVENWSQFTLRSRTSDPNPLHWPIIATGHKLSYCLVNLDDCTGQNGYCTGNAGQVVDQDTMPNAGLGRVTGCQRDQGIYPGKLDIYDQGLDGQVIPLTNVCNGDYYLVSHTDPDNIFVESNDSNNVAISPITLSGQPLPFPTTFGVRMTTASQMTAGAAIPPGTTFTWDFGDGSVDSVNSIVVHDYTASGHYIVRLTIHYRCGNVTQTYNVSSEQTVDVTDVTSVHLTPAELNLTAVPNPASQGRFTLSFRKPTAAAASLRITDLAGHTVYAQQVEGNPGKAVVPVQTRGLSAGVYMVNLRTEAGSTAVRLVME